MVEKLDVASIRVSSSLNDWMEVIFIVNKADEEKAEEVLRNAWNDYWESNAVQCYGDFLEERMNEADIKFNAYYPQEEGE